ncbi:DUF7916 family protein [Mesobacillus subterraneus]|uniref:DUF7916 family protein n=1 Tax=Mesobacillus subterraneus TaxID=285983 RepID=UPI003FCC7D0C
MKEALNASEGRTIISELIGAFSPLYPTATNAELIFMSRWKPLCKVIPDFSSW